MPVRAVAAPPADAGLTAGMGYSDVIHLKGPATSKEELESKREDLWSYPGIVLTFHEGKLSKWRTVDAKSPLIYAAPPAALAASAAVQVAPPTEALPSSSGAQTVDDLAKGVKPKDKARVAGLISEIMKELPADDTAGGTGSGGPPSPPMGMLPTDIVRAPR
ncbi:MAG: hypothetical protein K1X83_09535 [Oligoflexia bacterium]|nr:hypothetical protein [Oligoflexia bacterium]